MISEDFNAVEHKDHIVQWIRDWFEENGKDCWAVIGISGGKDSTVAAALCVEALGRERVFGVLMPCGNQSDIDASYKLCGYLNIAHREIDIFPMAEDFGNSLARNGLYPTEQAEINLLPRIRMTTLYAVAATIGGRVCNTGNASAAFVGYTTKYGDLAGDFALLKNFTVSEIFEIGDYLGLPYDLVHKTPSDGMSGKSDEENFAYFSSLFFSNSFLISSIIANLL